MTVRIKSRWHKTDKPKSVKEIAGALAFIAWRLAVAAVRNLEEEGALLESDARRLDLVQEFLAFLVQAADRLAYRRMDDEDRRRFVTELALRLADTLQDNQADVAGPGDYRTPFIERLNSRMSDYAEFSFNDDEPGFGCLRYLGERVDEALGKGKDRWVLEQAAEVEGPQAVKRLRKALEDLSTS